MIKLLSALSFCALAQVGLAQFDHNIPRFTRQDLWDVEFLNPNKGFAVGDSGIIARTLDGGFTWTKVEGGRTNTFHEIHFFDSLNGMAMGRDIYLTSDGGNTWQDAQAPMDSVFDFDDLGPTTCVVSGLHHELYRSTDKGVSWTLICDSTNNPYDIGSFDFTTNQVGFAYEKGRFYHSYMLKTIDGGLSWTQVFDNRPFQQLYYSEVQRLVFLNDSVGFRFGRRFFIGQNIQTTRDGGKNWIGLRGTTTSRNTAMFIDPNNTQNFYAGGYKRIAMKSIDIGKTWHKIVPNGLNEDDFYGYYFINDTLGWAVGENGIIARTTNAVGPPYLQNAEKSILAIQSVQLYPNPAKDIIHVEGVEEREILQLWAVDLLGRCTSLAYNAEGISIDHLPSGSYQLIVETTSGLHIQKLLIQ